MTDRAPPWENGTGDYLAEEYGASSGRTGHNCGRSSRRRAESPNNVPASSRQCGCWKWRETGKEGCDGLLVGMEFVMPFFVLEDFLQA